MRFVYLDEAGIANIKDEPQVVVAGIIVHADKQWIPLEKYLQDMMIDLIPPDKRKGFYFHATDLFHGSGLTPREDFPKDYRWDVLEELCQIPIKFDLPIVMGFYDRKKVLEEDDISIHDATIQSLATSATICAMATERYMRQSAPKGEVATIVYEDNRNAKKIIRTLHNQLRSPELIPSVKEHWKEYLPLTRIVDTAHFAEKEDTSLLQLADVCAFILKRRLIGKKDVYRFSKHLEQNLIVRPVAFDSSTES